MENVIRGLDQAVKGGKGQREEARNTIASFATVLIHNNTDRLLELGLNIVRSATNFLNHLESE